MSDSASASTSTNPPSIPLSQPPSTSQNASSSSQLPSHSEITSNSQSASPTLPHSPETVRQIAEARAALEASMTNIGSSLDHTLKTRAQNLHSNSAALEQQQKDLVKETEGLRKETDKLKKVADEGARRVKELGNVQNWAEMLERDFLVLGETMRLVRKADRGSGWDGQEEGWETSSGSESWSGSEDEDGDGHGHGHGDDHGHVEGRDHAMGGTSGGGAARKETQKDSDASEGADKTFEEDDTVKPGLNERPAVDGEGDTTMDGVESHKSEDVSTSKGKEVEVQQQADVTGGSSTAATAASSSTSTADPSSSSIHTAASATS